eukprot:scaffold101400_cov30-Tisochrysis_lutea.AAC.8
MATTSASRSSLKAPLHALLPRGVPDLRALLWPASWSVLRRSATTIALLALREGGLAAGMSGRRARCPKRRHSSRTRPSRGAATATSSSHWTLCSFWYFSRSNLPPSPAAASATAQERSTASADTSAGFRTRRPAGANRAELARFLSSSSAHRSRASSSAAGGPSKVLRTNLSSDTPCRQRKAAVECKSAAEQAPTTWTHSETSREPEDEERHKRVARTAAFANRLGRGEGDAPASPPSGKAPSTASSASANASMNCRNSPSGI